MRSLLAWTTLESSQHIAANQGNEMSKTTITKSRAGHYWLTVRDAQGRILLRDQFSTLEAARAAAVKAAA